MNQSDALSLAAIGAVQPRSRGGQAARGLALTFLGLLVGPHLPAQAQVPAAPAVSLETCIRTALEGSPDIEAAVRRIEAAQAAVTETQSAWYPWLSLSPSYTRTDNPPQAFFMALNQRNASLQNDFNNPPDTGNVRLSAAVKYRVFDGGRRALDGRIAQRGADLAQAGHDAVRNELIYQVTRGYYGVLQARAFAEVQEESVRSLEESYRVAQERHTAGSAVKTDVLNLDVKLAQAREDLIRARNGVKLAVAALNTAMGRDVATSSNVAGIVAGTALPEAPAEAGGIQQRPELKMAKHLTELRATALSKARREYIPVVNAFGEMDWDSDRLNDFERSYLAGVAAEWELFSGFRSVAGVKRARADLAATRAESERTRNQLRLDLIQARLALEESRERLGVTQKSVNSAVESLRITGERYKQGSADITELLTAQVGLTATRTRDVAAYYDCLTAVSNVERAQGQLTTKWECKK